MSVKHAAQILSISTALVASGGIATLSLFDVPILKSQPASRSLPLTRWLFSRGSHIFPTAALVSSSGFAFLAYNALPNHANNLSAITRHLTKGHSGVYLAAAVLSISIAPFTSLMIPTNFRIIRKNEEKGGSRNAASAEHRDMAGAWPSNVEESTDGKGDLSQWWDWSGPQEETPRASTKKEDEETKKLLDRFGKLNVARAALMGAGGLVGLAAALA